MDDHRHVAVAIKIPQPQAYAKGGLASAARNVAGAGVGGDTMIVHINRPEFDELRRQWGEPTINPHTGMAQFTPFYKQDWFAPVAGILGSAIGAPLIGEAIAGATGLSSTAANALGGALIGGGIGGLSNGGQGALMGALAGGATPLVSGLLGGSGGGLGSLFGLGSGGAGSSESGSSGAASSGSSDSGKSSGSSGGGLLGSGGKGALGALMAGLLLADTVGKVATGGKSQAEKDAEGRADEARAQFNKPLPKVSFQRQQQTFQPQDYYSYGFGPSRSQFSGNQLPQRVDKAKGGAIAAHARGLRARPSGRSPRLVKGPGDGRADVVPANLSNGEYVFDAESTALLGNGSPEAGAQKLDQMRVNLRKHKGGALAQGKFTPPAKSPEQYMRGGRV